MDLTELHTQLKQAYPYRIELHAHTKPASSCGDIAPEDVVKIFADSGYHGIAVTNHFFTGNLENHLHAFNRETAVEKYAADYERAKEAGEKCGIKVYLGAELRWDHLSNNDYLLYGIDTKMLGEIYDYIKTDPETFVRDCKSEKSFFVQAHPFRNGLTCLDPELLDGVEAFNMHPGHNSRVGFSVRHAQKYNKILTMGTDYHHEGHHDLCATRMTVLPQDSFELAAELKKNNFIAEIGNSLILP